MTEQIKIFVLKDIIRNKFKEKGSSFLGYAIKVNSSVEAIEKLNEIRKKYYDATHHCYAYLTLTNEEKYSDDGEPNGTAGIRILNAIKRFHLKDILVVVIRYFGGTKLGLGALGKAYSTSALSLLETAHLIELEEYFKITIEYNFENSSNIHYLINKYNAKGIKSIFVKNPIIECYIKPIALDGLEKDLTNITKGKGLLTTDSRIIYLHY